MLKGGTDDRLRFEQLCGKLGIAIADEGCGLFVGTRLARVS